MAYDRSVLVEPHPTSAAATAAAIAAAGSLLKLTSMRANLALKTVPGQGLARSASPGDQPSIRLQRWSQLLQSSGKTRNPPLRGRVRVPVVRDYSLSSVSFR